MDTKLKGNLGELRVAADLISKGYRIALPFGDDWKCDLLACKGKDILRIQVKYLESTEEVMVVRCTSTTKHLGGETLGTPYTVDDVDFIAAFDKRTDQCYYLPIKECSGSYAVSLRFTPTKNNQTFGIRWAKDYASIA